MGLFDFFRRGDEPTEGQLQKAVKQVTQPHGDPAVRLGAFDRLAAWNTEGAMSALLRRFTIQTSSGQVDLEECQEVERMLVAAGEVAVAPILSFLARESAVAYPARALRRIVPQERFVTEVLRVLAALETDFGSQDDQRAGLLHVLEGVDDPRIAPGVRPFLEDPNDDVVVSAVTSIAQRGDVSYRGHFADVMEACADRPRVREEVAERLVELGWPMQEDRKRVETALPHGFLLDKKGRVTRLG